jgi:alanine racemase
MKKGLHRNGCRPDEFQSLRLCQNLELRVVFGHLRTIKRFESALVASGAVDFGDIALGA